MREYLEQFHSNCGNVCIGRYKYHDSEFIFDYGILSYCKKLAEASQNVVDSKEILRAGKIISLIVFTTPNLIKWLLNGKKVMAFSGNCLRESGGECPP